MKIENKGNGIGIDGQAYLTIAPYGAKYCLNDARTTHDVQLHIENFHFVRPVGKTRIGRLYSLLKYLWRYTA